MTSRLLDPNLWLSHMKQYLIQQRTSTPLNWENAPGVHDMIITLCFIKYQNMQDYVRCMGETRKYLPYILSSQSLYSRKDASYI